jgi:protein required for attachment to host cells
MILPPGTHVAVVDGEKLLLLRHHGGEGGPKLTAETTPAIGGANKSGGAHHGSSAANPDDSRLEEDSFAAATAEYLNREVMAGRIANLVVVAPAKSLGELRKHYHKTLEAKLVGELSKDLVNAPIPEIEKALHAA